MSFVWPRLTVVVHVQEFNSCEIIQRERLFRQWSRKQDARRVVCTDSPFSGTVWPRLHPEVVRSPDFRSLKGSLLLRRSLVLSLSRHILQRGIHESSLCTACQRFAVNLPPSAVPRPGFNCLHDKRTSRKVVHIRRTFHPFSGQKKEEKQLSTFFVDFPVG